MINVPRNGWALLVICLTLIGCGANDRVSVSGRVTYGGSEWPTEGLITFNCVEPDPGFPRNSGTGRFDRKGNYVVSSQSGKSPGLYPGRYKINLACWEVAPSMQGPPAKSYIPPEFFREDNDRLTLQVKVGPPLIHNFDVPKVLLEGALRGPQANTLTSAPTVKTISLTKQTAN
jgi:hypothetical protein